MTIYCLDLKGVSLIFVFHNGHLWKRLHVAFLALNLHVFLYMYLQVTGVCNIVTSPVARQSTDLAFTFEKEYQINPFQDRLIIFKETYSY